MKEQEKWIELLEKQFYAKSYHRDMVWDFCNILSTKLLTFQNNVDDFEKNRAKEALRPLIPYSKAPTARYRMYIVSGVQFFSFAWVGMKYEDFERINKLLKQELGLCERMPSESLEPNLVSTVYLLNDKDFVIAEDIYPSHLAWLLISLSKNNLINF